MLCDVVAYEVTVKHVVSFLFLSFFFTSSWTLPFITNRCSSNVGRTGGAQPVSLVSTFSAFVFVFVCFSALLVHLPFMSHRPSFVAVTIRVLSVYRAVAVFTWVSSFMNWCTLLVSGWASIRIYTLKKDNYQIDITRYCNHWIVYLSLLSCIRHRYTAWAEQRWSRQLHHDPVGQHYWRLVRSFHLSLCE